MLLSCSLNTRYYRRLCNPIWTIRPYYFNSISSSNIYWYAYL